VSDPLGVWDLEVSHIRAVVILRRRRPDMGPCFEEVRTYPIAVVIAALVAAPIHRELTEKVTA
jgi:hypothetical protein